MSSITTNNFQDDTVAKATLLVLRELKSLADDQIDVDERIQQHLASINDDTNLEHGDRIF